MDKADNELSEQARRRKRINLYKRIIVILIITMILLPTILCIILFFRINYLNRELNDLKVSMLERDTILAADAKDTDKYKPLPEPPSSYYGSNTNTSDNRTEPSGETVTEPSEEESTQESGGMEEESTEVFRPATEYSAEVQQALNEGRKVVYLTFDDGPWEKTPILLDVLAKYNVKATFFVIGNPGFEDMYNRIVDEGHTLAMHTYSHRYDVVYGGLESFENEVTQLSTYLQSVTGIKPYIFRFPGGSSTAQTNNIKPYIDYINQENLVYYDWNVSSGDAVINPLTAEQIYNNVMSGIATQNVSVVLMHDSYCRETTVEALPAIIESLQAMNALILPITEDTVPVHHNVK